MEDELDIDSNVTKARAHVKLFAEGTHEVDGWKKIGEMEARAAKIMLAALDEDGDGKLSKEERAAYIEVGNQMVDRTLQMCLNAGVVSALVLSIFFPYAFDSLEPSEASIDFFSASSREILITIHDVLITMTIASNICLIFTSVFIITVLMSWLPQFEAQQWWVATHYDLLMYVQVIVPFNLIWSMSLLPIFGGLLVSPRKGFIAMFCFASVAYLYVTVLLPNQARVRAMQYKQARKLFKLPTDHLPEKIYQDGPLCMRTGKQSSSDTLRVNFWPMFGYK